MDLIPMLILGGLALLAWTFIEPMLKGKPAVVAPVVPVPLPIENVVARDYSKDFVVTALDDPSPPRWQKFDNLLQMRDDLVSAGHPEDEVAKTCAELAAKLLGVKK